MPAACVPRFAPHYPFAAIVGQAALKHALLLAAVNPAIRGVLVFGEKGTAKSTTARALVDLLPALPFVTGCPYHCNPDRPQQWCADCRTQGTPPRAPGLRPAPFVTLPLNATLDRVVGAVHWEDALRYGRATVQPGLIAQANGGILYVDEVNLLDEAVAGALLDAAETGVNYICREGITLAHPAWFTLLGTMNPEEGPLPPQLLDRFGLVVYVEAEADLAMRAEVLRRRLAFEADPVEFCATWSAEQARLRADIAMVRERVSRVRLPTAVLQDITEWCVSHGVAGHRADLRLAEAARAVAAWAGEPVVTRAHVERVSHFVLQHRTRDTAKGGAGEVPGPGLGDGDGAPQEQQRSLHAVTPETADKDEDAVGGEMTRGCQSEVGQMFRSEDGTQSSVAPSIGAQFTGEDDGAMTGTEHRGQRTAGMSGKVTEIAEGLHAAHLLREKQRHRRRVAGKSGRRVTGQSVSRRGRYYRARLNATPVDLAVDATVRAAAVRAGLQGGREPGGRLRVERQDLHEKLRRQRTKSLILFVVDASGSLGEHTMSMSKGAVMALLRDAYQQRDRVGLIAFRDYEASMLLPPTNSVDLARARLAALPVGGKTPLAKGLALGYETIAKVRRREAWAPVTLVLLSDGRANVGLRDSANRPAAYQGGGDSGLWEEVLRVGEALGRLEGVDIVCVDTTPRHKPPSLLPDLAARMKARYVGLETLMVRDLLQALREAPRAERRATVVRMWQ